MHRCRRRSTTGPRGHTFAMTLVMLMAVAAAASRPDEWTPPSLLASPCSDSLYVELQKRPVREMTEGEAAYFATLQTMCLEHQSKQAQGAKTPPAKRVPTARQRAAMTRASRIGMSVILFSIAATAVASIVALGQIKGGRR